MSKKSSIEVAIRIRPMRTELNESKVVWEVNSTSLRERANPDCHFTFERVYNSNSTTKDMYELSVRDNIVKNVALGYNGTVFAYGQTGSGKSFTMLGTNDPNNEGIVAMAVRDLFLALDKERQNNKQVDIQVYLTILEIYNEQLRDLLVPPGGVAAALAIRENEHGVYVHNAARRLVKNAKECLYVMQQEAESRRVSAATAMNERSSRSHCLIRVHVEKTFTFDAESDDEDSEGEDASPAGDALKKKIVSSLNLVDLAGSERVAKTGATGQRMVEGGHINKSLTILTTVINRLTETSKSGTTGYIPYRDSKLTHLLKTAIGGNSFTTVFCCMTPAEQHVDESRSTLQFAARAKTIKNEVSMNEIADSKTKIRELEADIKRRKSLMVAMQLYLWSKEIKIKMLTDGSGSGGAGFDGKGSAGKGGSSSSAAGGGPSSPLRAVQAAADEQLCQLQLIVEQLEQRNEALQKDLRDAKAKAGAGGYVDPMSGMVADDPEKRQLRQRCNELQRNVEDLTEEKNDVQEALDELDELCRELESENTQVSGELNELQQKYRAQEAQLQSAKGLEQSLKNQVEQLQGQLRGEERRLLEQARGDELLESLTKLHVEHQSLQFEHNTLMDMYTREEVDREAAKTALKERLAEVENEKDDLRATNQLQNSYLWRLLSVAALVTRGKTIDPDETRSAVRESQVESAVQSLTAFVSSRMNRPPGVVTEDSIKTPATAQGARATLFGNPDEDDDDFDIPLDRAAKQSQQRSAANNNNNSNNSAATAATVNSGSAMSSTSTGSGGDVSSLEKRVKDLEQQLVAKDAQRDIIIDTKLKRIQDLVLRLHTTNQKLTQELHAATEQNEKLFEIVKKDPRFANKAAKGGLQPFVEADALARANYAPVPQKPFGHN